MCCIQQRLSGLVVLCLAINKREIHMYFGVDKFGWGFHLATITRIKPETDRLLPSAAAAAAAALADDESQTPDGASSAIWHRIHVTHDSASVLTSRSIRGIIVPSSIDALYTNPRGNANHGNDNLLPSLQSTIPPPRWKEVRQWRNPNRRRQGQEWNHPTSSSSSSFSSHSSPQQEYVRHCPTPVVDTAAAPAAVAAADIPRTRSSGIRPLPPAPSAAAATADAQPHPSGPVPLCLESGPPQLLLNKPHPFGGLSLDQLVATG
jgi:hypothetical protein